MYPNLTRILLTGTLAVGLLTAVGSAVVLADDDDDEDERRGGQEHSEGRRFGHDVAPVRNAQYAEECGGCHLAYQPGLLPAGDWARLLATDALAEHFGDDASLPEETRGALEAYLTANAADGGETPRSRAFARGSAPGATGLPRITETRYFRKEHDEIPARLVVDNPDVGSLAQCNKCHQGAADGDYSEKRINIPGHGPWED